MSPALAEARYPTTIRGQFRRHLPQYAVGTATLAAFQYALYLIDWQSKAAVDLIFGPRPSQVWVPAAIILSLAVVAFFVRVTSRWFIFNAGRDSEYELRYELLRKLHQLGVRRLPQPVALEAEVL